MRLSLWVSALSALATASPIDQRTPTLRRDLSFDYNDDKVRGVNLGGWFVLEPFITPSVFAAWANGGGVVDEYTYSAALGKDEAQKRLADHWRTWITRDDFDAIAHAGLNHVRIPIGYWAVSPQPGDPYVQGQLDVLDQAITWARGAGLKVLLDLHGAPRSQNGFDNSGHNGTVGWQQGSSVQATLNAIDGLAGRYAGATDVVTAIELLNEPLGPSLDLGALKKFYYDGYGKVRTQNGDTAVVIHDAFQDLSYWQGFMAPGDDAPNNIILDTHQYQVFTDELVGMDPQQHVQAACAYGGRLSGADKWTVVGEFTGAQTDCAKWLNGLGRGARYDGTLYGTQPHGSCQNKYQGSVKNMLQVDKDNLRHFVEAQLDAYEQRTGWIFWTWKTESAPEWNMKDLLANGLVPQPLNSRKYPGQCS